MQVPRIAAPPSTIDMYKENFGRLNMWAWTEYARVLYVDADTIVTGDIAPLLHLPAGMTGAVGRPSRPFSSEPVTSPGVQGSCGTTLPGAYKLSSSWLVKSVWSRTTRPIQGLQACD